MKKFKLYEKDNKHHVGQILLKTHSHSVSGTAWMPTAWLGEEEVEKDFFANFTVKWDGCSHVYFYGHDHPTDGDSYYHICGVRDYLTHMRLLQFVLEVAYQELKGVFLACEVDDLMDLRKLNLLEGCEIKEFEATESDIEEYNELKKRGD